MQKAFTRDERPPYRLRCTAPSSVPDQVLKHKPRLAPERRTLSQTRPKRRSNACCVRVTKGLWGLEGRQCCLHVSLWLAVSGEAKLSNSSNAEWRGLDPQNRDLQGTKCWGLREFRPISPVFLVHKPFPLHPFASCGARRARPLLLTTAITRLDNAPLDMGPWAFFFWVWMISAN